MKKILVISPFFYPHTGGSQQYMEELYATLLKKHKDIKVTVLAYNTDKVKYRENYRGLEIIRFDCWSVLPGQFALPNYIEVASFLINNKDKFDIVHCNTRFFESSWWAPFIAKLFGKKVLITDHCSSYPEHKNEFIKQFARIIDKVTSSIFLRLYDEVFATNYATQKFLKDEFGINSRVIYGGIDTKLFKLKVRKNKRLKVLFVGRMINSKGPGYLYEVAKSMADIDFTFVGPGPLVEVLKKEKLPNVKILGGRNRVEVARLMREADILVHPSTHHEGFPNVLTEAGASGLAVIATDTGGVKEIISKGCGILIQPNKVKDKLKSELEKLIKSKELREGFGKNLYKHVSKNYSWEKAAKELYSNF